MNTRSCFAWIVLVVSACGNGDGGADDGSAASCLETPADATCDNVLYGIHDGEIAPTFNDVFTRTLEPTCGSSTACHAGDNAPAGLRFDQGEDAAFEVLRLDAARGNPRVAPGDLACAEVVIRLETDDAAYEMPPGTPLSEAERCAIRHWIADGAQR